MSTEEIARLIIRQARRDCFRGVGRLFIKPFLKEYGVSEGDFMEALRLIPNTMQIKRYLDEPKILLVQL